ncbi:MAG: hypothetical protein IJ567_06060 [Lachnospiraceae bacterium]|nr:hypothetical protein [Lachnospiraceae bacterium]
MILVDKNIKEYVSKNELITEGYDEANVNGVSYDLTIGSILDEKENEVDEYQLEPGEIVFIKSREMLKIPLDILGRIAEKNSRMRQGLKIDGPHYQPGHETYPYLRVQNVSGTNTVTLTKGMRVAQIIFEQLQEQPDVTYDLQKGASFQNEEKYRGLGNYQKEYSRQIRSKEKQALDELENVSQKIYANVLTIMGVLVVFFSLLTIIIKHLRKL